MTATRRERSAPPTCGPRPARRTMPTPHASSNGVPASAGGSSPAAPGLRLGVDLLLLDELNPLHDRPWFIPFTYDGEKLAHADTLSAERRSEFLAARFAANEAALQV